MSVNYQPLLEKIASGSRSYFLFDKQERYFVFDKRKIKYFVGRDYNFSDSEEKTRMKYYFDLIEKYQYPISGIEFEIGVLNETPCQYADIVVFTNDKIRKPYLVAECKKSGISETEFQKAMKQAVANAKLLKAEFAVCIAGEKCKAIKINGSDNEIEVNDIPVYYGKKGK